jgi:hypothetical protein
MRLALLIVTVNVLAVTVRARKILVVEVVTVRVKKFLNVENVKVAEKKHLVVISVMVVVILQASVTYVMVQVNLLYLPNHVYLVKVQEVDILKLANAVRGRGSILRLLTAVNVKEVVNFLQHAANVTVMAKLLSLVISVKEVVRLQ